MDMDMEKQATVMKVTSINDLSVSVSVFLTVLKMKFNTEKEIW